MPRDPEDEKGKKERAGVTFPPGRLDTIDDIVEEKEFKNRSAFINEAIEEKLEREQED